MKRFGRIALAVIITVLCVGCYAEQPIESSAPIQPRTTTAPITPTSDQPAPNTVAPIAPVPDLVSLADELDSCVESGKFQVALGTKFWSDIWNEVDHDEVRLRLFCVEQAAANPGWLHRFHLDWKLTERRIAATMIADAAATAPVTLPRITLGPAPVIALNCGPAVSGNWDWYRIEYGYSIWSSSEIVEWGMNYGDQRSYVSYNENDATRDVFWHKYTEPGSYTASAWIKDSHGRRASDTCLFQWSQPVVTQSPLIPQTPSTPLPPSTPRTGGRTGAICRDGWRSSSTGSGTCSHHGGVAYWLY